MRGDRHELALEPLGPQSQQYDGQWLADGGDERHVVVAAVCSRPTITTPSCERCAVSGIATAELQVSPAGGVHGPSR